MVPNLAKHLISITKATSLSLQVMNKILATETDIRKKWMNVSSVGNNFIIPFVPNAPFLYPPKTSENGKIFWCFQGVEKECIGNEWANDTHREKLCFTRFSTRIDWNRSLSASDLFHTFTQSIKLYPFHCHILKSTYVWKRWFIK